MKNALILHGTSCTPQSFWQPSIKSFLESKGYEVIVPQLPEADTPDLEKWLESLTILWENQLGISKN